MADHLIGAINHHGWADVCCWIRSARLQGFLGQVTLIVYDDVLSRDLRLIQSAGVTIVSRTLSGSVNVQRYSDIASVISTLPAGDRVLTTDVRDVAFQANISESLNRFLQKYDLFLASEGWEYRHSIWNSEEMHTHYPEEAEKLCNELIYCSGVIAGRADALRTFLTRVADKMKSARAGLGDQSAVNIVIRTDEFYNKIFLANLADGHCCHFAVCADENKTSFTQAGVEPPPYFDHISRLAVTSNGIPFSIFHQYTKIPSVRRGVLAHNRVLQTFYFEKLRSSLLSRLPWSRRPVPYWKRPEIVGTRPSE